MNNIKLNNIKSFVTLKYQILTSKSDTWGLCETYPKEVVFKWLWECALDIEHLVKGHATSENLIKVAKKYRDGLASDDELNTAIDANQTEHPKAKDAIKVAGAILYAAKYESNFGSSVCGVARAVDFIADAKSVYYANNWHECTKRLIEELCEWEMKQ